MLPFYKRQENEEKKDQNKILSNDISDQIFVYKLHKTFSKHNTLFKKI